MLQNKAGQQNAVKGLASLNSLLPVQQIPDLSQNALKQAPKTCLFSADLKL